MPAVWYIASASCDDTRGSQKGSFGLGPMAKSASSIATGALGCTLGGAFGGAFDETAGAGSGAGSGAFGGVAVGAGVGVAAEADAGGEGGGELAGLTWRLCPQPITARASVTVVARIRFVVTGGMAPMLHGAVEPSMVCCRSKKMQWSATWNAFCYVHGRGAKYA